ncbi:putative polysaccharide biosynthesis protein [Aminicella lysinilytica]|uniref:putative polysaccharide biosynthesis protein n=1 Tax=Aminicella lysinilytica TaxID=433323 RepID=UPI0026EE6DAE|nr:polysaccharide biosynthesis protein [Aminicella lysinilytica]
MANKGNKFIKGAAVLAGAGIMIKVLGAVFRIPLTDWIGATGMSYYGVAYSIYGALVVLATAGIPVAISRLVSESIAVKQYKNAHKTFRVATVLLFAVGLISFAICFFGGNWIAELFGNKDAGPAVRAISPALLFVPVFSAFRGYFNGRQNMNPTAISEITEQLVRCGVGLYLAYSLYKTSLIKAAAGASFGASAGSIAGLLIIFLIYLMNKKSINHKIEVHNQAVESSKKIAKKIVIIAIPIIIGCEIMPIMTLIDTSIIMRVLQSTGWSLAESNYLYGLLSGFCNALIAFPQIFTQAVAVSLVPAISAHFKLKEMDKVNDTIALGYRTTMIMAFPCAFGIFVLAEPILKLLYFAQPQGCHDAAPTLMIMAISVIFLAVMQTSTSVLQSIGKQMIPVRNLAIGCVGKVVITYVLVGIPALNIKGAALGTMFAYFIAMVLNGLSVKKYTGIKYDMKLTYGRPAAAAIVMAGCAFGIYKGLFALLNTGAHSAVGISGLCTVIAILAAMVIYAVLIFAVKAITVDELETMPGGTKLAKIARKFIHE